MVFFIIGNDTKYLLLAKNSEGKIISEKSHQLSQSWFFKLCELFKSHIEKVTSRNATDGIEIGFGSLSRHPTKCTN